MMSSEDFVLSTAAGLAGSLPDGVELRSAISDPLFCAAFEASGVDDFCIVGRLLSTVAVVSRVFSPLAIAGVLRSVDGVLIIAASLACSPAGREGLLLSEVTGGSGFFCANLFRMPLSVMCKRAETDGKLIKVDGNRVTSFFMSDSSSSNWLRTKMIKFKD